MHPIQRSKLFKWIPGMRVHFQGDSVSVACVRAATIEGSPRTGIIAAAAGPTVFVCSGSGLVPIAEPVLHARDMRGMGVLLHLLQEELKLPRATSIAQGDGGYWRLYTGGKPLLPYTGARAQSAERLLTAIFLSAGTERRHETLRGLRKWYGLTLLSLSNLVGWDTARVSEAEREGPGSRDYRTLWDAACAAHAEGITPSALEESCGLLGLSFDEIAQDRPPYLQAHIMDPEYGSNEIWGERRALAARLKEERMARTCSACGLTLARPNPFECPTCGRIV